MFFSYLLGKRPYVCAGMLFTVPFCLNLFVCIRRGCGYKEKDERDVGREIPAVVLTRLRLPLYCSFDLFALVGLGKCGRSQWKVGR